MVHVEDMPKSIDFYQALGGRMVFGSRDGDWALMQFEGSTLSILARPPGDGTLETVELQFVSETSLNELEAYVKSIDPALIDRGVGDEAFGRMLKLKTADGLLIKVLQLERDLIA